MQAKPIFKQGDLYPIAIYPWGTILGCIYGDGEGKGIIEL